MTNYSSRKYKKFWDIKKLDELQGHLEKGLPYLKIANKMNVSLNAIMVARKRYGLKALSKQFMTPQSISREMGISCQKSVAVWVKKKYLHSRKFNKLTLISRDEWIKFLENPKYWCLWNPEKFPKQEGVLVQLNIFRDWVLEMRKDIEFYSTGEAAKIKFTTVRTVNGWIRKGWLKAEKKGFNWFILRDDLLKFEPPGVGGNFNHRFLTKIN